MHNLLKNKDLTPKTLIKNINDMISSKNNYINSMQVANFNNNISTIFKIIDSIKRG